MTRQCYTQGERLLMVKFFFGNRWWFFARQPWPASVSSYFHWAPRLQHSSLGPRLLFQILWMFTSDIFRSITLQETNISHLGKRKIIFKSALVGNMWRQIPPILTWEAFNGGDWDIQRTLGGTDAEEQNLGRWKQHLGCAGRFNQKWPTCQGRMNKPLFVACLVGWAPRKGKVGNCH